MKITIKLPTPSSLSNVELEQKMQAMRQAHDEVKAYRISLTEESDKRQGLRPANLGSNPVRIKMKPAIIKARAGK